MSKHTPGPWRISGGSSHVVTAGIKTVADCRNNSTHPYLEEEAAANARLIAAAPDLLEALKVAASYFAELDAYPDQMAVSVDDRITDAIARAETP